VYRTVELSILATARPFLIATQCTFITATYTKHSFDVFASNIATTRPFVAKCLPVTKVKTEKLCKNIYQLLCFFFFLRLLILLRVYLFITDYTIYF